MPDGVGEIGFDICEKMYKGRAPFLQIIVAGLCEIGCKSKSIGVIHPHLAELRG